jgi:predicted nucleic-acid-binding protein
MQYVLDTNVILRYLVGDDTNQQKQAEIWFREAQGGNRKIVISALVVAEACFVLESFYEKNRSEIADTMVVFLSQKWLVVPERAALLSMWNSYKDGLHLLDSYLIASSNHMSASEKTTVLSFDKQLIKSVV